LLDSVRCDGQLPFKANCNYYASFSARYRTRRAKSLLSPLLSKPITHHSVLSLATNHCSYGRSGLFGPPLCGGSAPATPPLCPRRSEFVVIMKLSSRGRRASTPHPASWHIQSMCQRRQDKRAGSHMSPTLTAMTIASSLQKYGRYIPPRQTAHRTHSTWLSSYSRLNMRAALPPRISAFSSSERNSQCTRM